VVIEGWLTYANESYGFSFIYPETWLLEREIDEESKSMNIVNLLEPYEDKGDEIRGDWWGYKDEVVRIQLQYLELEPSSKDEYVQTLIDRYEATEEGSRTPFDLRITDEDINYINSERGLELIKIENERVNHHVYLASKNESWSQVLLILVSGDQDPLTEDVILSMSW
jgi:hypothetical protein